MGWLWGSDSSSDSASSGSSSSSFDSDFSSSSGLSSFDSSSSSFDSSSPLSDIGSDLSSSAHGKDAELQTFLAKEQQRAQLQAMIHQMNDTCWDTCVGAPESKLGSRTETCISNCVERFIDSSLFITNRFAQLLSKQGGASFG